MLGGRDANHFTLHIRCLDCDADGLMRPGRKRLYVAGAACTGCQSKGGARGEPRESPARGLEVAGPGKDTAPRAWGGSTKHKLSCITILGGTTRCYVV